MMDKKRKKQQEKRARQKYYYYASLAAACGIVAWMVMVAFTDDVKPKRSRQPPNRMPVPPSANEPPGPDVKARITVKASDNNAQVFLDVKHGLEDMKGIEADVDAFMFSHGVPGEYKEQLVQAAVQSLRQQAAEGGGMPDMQSTSAEDDEEWADKHLDKDDEDEGSDNDEN
eukprot:758358-Hanusia_phi.AAC.2